MILFLNTTTRGHVDLRLFDVEGTLIRFRREDDMPLEQVLQRTMDFVGPELQKLEGIVVVDGPIGSFSSIRGGVAIANALGYGRGIPVMGLTNRVLGEASIREAVQRVLRHNATDHAVAHYSSAPHISQSLSSER
jgi:tRNA A37 threonylcarbamoyladenosine modification protein TsaB